MRRLSLLVAAFLTIACTDNPIEPKAAPRLNDTGGRRQLTSVAWEKSTTGIDMVAIGPYNGRYTILIDINDNDLAVGWGYADTPEGPRERAISWKNGVFTDLGTLGGNFSEAYQTNNAGVIVGASQDAAGRYSPAVWENGSIRSLPRLLPDYYVFAGGGAQAINERGDIVGYDYGYGGIHAALWPATGGVVDLGLLPGTDFSYAGGINRDGTVMGRSISYSTFIGRPTVWSGGAMAEIVLPPGGRAVNNMATGQMFNDAGDFLAVITATDPFYFGRAIAFRKGAFETLAMLPNAFQELSEPYGLNEAGDIVGMAYGPSNFNPVLWSHDGTLTDLGQPSGMRGGDAHGINNRGLIVGQAHGEWTPGTFNSGAVLWRVAGDVTPPTIGYSSHAATYTVDEHVSITCTATDAESGIASDTCAPIDGDAYVFGLGQHTFSAMATDNAGNSATASTSFSVSVTFGSLTKLTRRFVTNSKVADALAANLRDAEEARVRGKEKQAEAKLDDYRHGVQAQVGKSITADRGSLLIGFSRAL
jgi:probable HAF family extracellular repeat protein